MGGKRCCISPAGEAASREKLHVSWRLMLPFPGHMALSKALGLPF
jgi:hypothetical protein